MLGTTRLVLRTFFAALLATSLVASTVLVASPASAQKIRPKFWGMHVVDWSKGPAVDVGVANLTTSGTYWRNIEIARGTYDWTRLDAQVEAAERQGAKPMVLLGHTPKFYSQRRGSAEYYSYMPKRGAWKRYVRKVAQRYGTRLDYQIWPEPNIIQNWKGTPRQMAKLTMWAAKEIHRVAPNATVVSPAVALRLEEQQRWMKRYFRQKVGGKRVHRYVDAVAVDPFPHQAGTPEDAYRIMKRTKRQLRRMNVRKPMWVNEINYGVAGGYNPSQIRYKGKVQRSYVVRTFVLAAAARMKRTYWHTWERSSGLGVHMITKKGRPAGPARAYKRVQKWLDGTWVRGCKTMRGGVWRCTAVKRTNGTKEVRRIYWKPKGSARVKTPRSTKRLQNLGGPVRYKRGARSIRVDFRPVMVASRK